MMPAARRRIDPASGCALALAALLATSCTGPATPDDDAGTTGVVTGAEALLVDRTNHERRRAGLQPLRPDARLAEAARLHADQLARASRLEHTLPGGRYPALEDRLRAAGYAWQAVGENLARGQQTAAQAVDTWMSSTPHRANLLSTTFTEIGAAAAADAGGGPYWVQVFGRP